MDAIQPLLENTARLGVLSVPKSENSGCTLFFRSRLVSLCILFIVFGVVGWTSYDSSPRTGVIGWYTTFVWTLPTFAVMAGIAGAVITVRTSRPLQDTDSDAIVSELLIVVVPTIGRSDTVEALERVVTSFCTHLPKHFTSVRVDIVIEESCDARDRITLLTSHQVKVSIITVPTAYRTRNGTQFKARANHYAHELRLTSGEATGDVWVLHMDDDTAIGEDGARSLAAFIMTHGSTEKRPLHLAQGVLSYPRDYATNRLTWLADAVRPGCDISIFAASTSNELRHTASRPARRIAIGTRVN